MPHRFDIGAVKSIDEPVLHQRNQYRTYETIRPYIYGSRNHPASGWDRQMELRKEMRISNTPIFRALARRIGGDRMRAGITKLVYGNMSSKRSIGSEDDRPDSRRWNRLSFEACTRSLPVDQKALKAMRELTLKKETAAINYIQSPVYQVPQRRGSAGGWAGSSVRTKFCRSLSTSTWQAAPIHKRLRRLEKNVSARSANCKEGRISRAPLVRSPRDQRIEKFFA